MKLLIITQVVDAQDPVLGFFVEWISAFAEHVESVEVICLRKGKYTLPDNVRVHSLGKEEIPRSRFVYSFRFFKLILRLRNQYDSVFVHMNPEYVGLAGAIWRLSGKRIVLWYTHKNVDLKLKIGVFFAHTVLTASKESFRLSTKKLKVMGHGINKDVFAPSSALQDKHRMVTIGRIAPAKGLGVLVDTMALLPKEYTLEIVGDPVSEQDRIYSADLERQVKKKNLPVQFLSSKEHAELPELLREYALFLHASSGTGSLDKAVLEALSSGVPVVSTSPAFTPILTPFGLSVQTAKEMASAIQLYASHSDSERIQLRDALRAEVVNHHSLSSLIPRILDTLSP